MRPAARHFRLMALTCNIDARGKAIRLRSGIALALVGGISTLLWAAPGGGTIAWIVSGTLLASAAVAIFEARAGWCIVRAAGIKLPF